MLPMTLQFIIVMIASAINERLRRKLAYLEEERRILREQLDTAIGGKRLSFTADQRPPGWPSLDGCSRRTSVGCAASW
jgi:hypothetical protein